MIKKKKSKNSKRQKQTCESQRVVGGRLGRGGEGRGPYITETDLALSKAVASCTENRNKHRKEDTWRRKQEHSHARARTLSTIHKHKFQSKPVNSHLLSLSPFLYHCLSL